MSENQNGDVAGEAVDETTDEDVNEQAETTQAETTEAETTEATEEAAAGAPGRPSQLLIWCRQRWGAVLLAAALLVSAGLAGGVYWWIYRPDRMTNAAAQAEVTEAAREGTVAILTYGPDTLDKDLDNAKSHLTGPFLKYYSEFTSKMVAPAAKQKGVKTEATVVRAAVSEMRPDRAVVMVFVNQVSSSKERPDPTLANSSVLVTLVRSDGRWLISEFTPV